MLEFVHRNAETENDHHIWPFVYLHGEAERMNEEAFSNGGDAPDLCMANEPIEKYIPDGLHGRAYKAINCVVGGKPAIVVLAKTLGENGPVCGRISLVDDVEAMRHTYTPENWR